MEIVLRYVTDDWRNQRVIDLATNIRNQAVKEVIVLAYSAKGKSTNVFNRFELFHVSA